MPRRPLTLFPILVGCAAVIVSFSACSSEPELRSESSPPSGDAPEFSGPWAAELLDAWNTATTDFEREALADGVVSELENAEMLDRLDRCLSDAGIEFTDTSGGYEFSFPESMSADEANSIADDCDRSSGEWTIGTMYSMVNRNPENADESTIMAACLVRVGVVPPGYTAADWDEEQAHPTALTDGDSASPDVQACSDDPLDRLDD